MSKIILISKERLLKFIDNPQAIFYFLKRISYDKFVADKYVPFYKSITFLNPEETFNHIIDNNLSIVRFGDGEFSLIRGASVYFNDWHQKYNKKLREALLKTLASQKPSVLLCFPEEYLKKTKQELIKEGKGSEYPYWINSKMILHNYLDTKKMYGSSFAFYPKLNTGIDYSKLKKYLNSKHVIIITSNTARFADIHLGKTTHLIEAPKSDSFDSIPSLKKILEHTLVENNIPKEEALVMVSMGPAAKAMVNDLVDEGLVVWDAGQFFDLASKKISELSL